MLTARKGPETGLYSEGKKVQHFILQGTDGAFDCSSDSQNPVSHRNDPNGSLLIVEVYLCEFNRRSWSNRLSAAAIHLTNHDGSRLSCSAEPRDKSVPNTLTTEFLPMMYHEEIITNAVHTARHRLSTSNKRRGALPRTRVRPRVGRSKHPEWLRNW